LRDPTLVIDPLESLRDGEPNPAVAGPREPSLADLMGVVRRQRRLVLGIPLVATAVVLIATLVWPRAYQSTASFTPQSTESKMGRLAGLASQFGVALPLGDTGPSLAFYAELLKSRAVLDSVIDTEYRFEVNGKQYSGRLEELLRVRGKTEEIRHEAALKKLRRLVGVTTNPTANLVKVSMKSRWAPLSATVLERMLAIVNEFNLVRRQSQASAERKFVGERLAGEKATLDSATARLQSFLQRNRDYRQSPMLTFEQDRLAREVTLRQQLYTSLAQAYDQARIDEVRDTPIITLVEHPNVPAKPMPMNLLLKAVLALVVGGLVGISAGFTREVVAGSTR
jgi:uncharacterized protein involved in exopolysaccharide biosynthesis